ncbi:amino acid transporter [Xylariaceae sp. FL0016]|nr:amino acid transporter [Xylariaceae sp. FL0016]
MAYTSTASALPWKATSAKRQSSSCTTLTQRKEWSTLTDDEQAAYIDAELCLMGTEPQLGTIDVAKSLWDELQYIHLENTPVAHAVGQFLPWHRGYVTLHERLLNTYCDYPGPTPYWNETTDVGDIAGSVLFTGTTNFGGNGEDGDGCVVDGPFANRTLSFTRASTASDSCLSRGFSDRDLEGASQSIIDECMAMGDYSTAWQCIHGDPHAAGHGGVAGTMVDVVLSPGDPLFYMHHGWIDYLWWKWQNEDLDTRLTEMDGNNVPDADWIAMNSLEPSASLTDYFGDDGNVTTLNHTLYYMELMANLTVADVMDVTGDTVCAEYV